MTTHCTQEKPAANACAPYTREKNSRNQCVGLQSDLVPRSATNHAEISSTVENGGDDLHHNPKLQEEIPTHDGRVNRR